MLLIGGVIKENENTTPSKLINSQMPFWSSSHLQSDSLLYDNYCIANWLLFLHYSSQESRTVRWTSGIAEFAGLRFLQMLPWLWLSGIRQGVNDTWKKACLNLHTVTSGLIIQSTPITAIKRTTNSYLHSSWKSKRNNSWTSFLPCDNRNQKQLEAKFQ